VQQKKTRDTERVYNARREKCAFKTVHTIEMKAKQNSFKTF